MHSLRILQYNTDNLRWGWEYLESVVKDSDIFLLQRFPKDKKSDLEDLLDGRTFMVESTPTVGDLCVVIGKSRRVSSFYGTESIPLPSAQHVMINGDAFQGCTALKTSTSGVNIVSALPCYSQSGGEFPISEMDRKTDIEHLLKECSDKPTIIAGDFHKHPDCESTNTLIEKYGFVSHLDEYNTWHVPGEEQKNLDKLITNFDVDISDVIVYDDKIKNKKIQGHIAISYTLTYDLKED